MARDYANKRQPEPERSRVPRWVWIFTGCASVAFVGFLYYLSQVPADGSSSGTQALKERLQQALPEASINDDSDSDSGSARTPTLEEAFEFYQLLKDDEVPVPTTAPRPSTNSGNANSAPSTPASGNRWEIQVASFSDAEDAERLRAQLIINGLTNTHLTEADLGDRGIYHRVMVGPFNDRSQLNKAQDILADLNHQVMVRSLN